MGYDRKNHNGKKFKNNNYKQNNNNYRKTYSVNTPAEELPFVENGPTYVIKFGKYKGVMLKDVPLEYLIWCIENIKNTVLNTFRREIQRRKNLILDFQEKDFNDEFTQN
jgi:hypothetical protein